MLNLAKRELLPIGTRVTVKASKGAAKRYANMTGVVSEYGHVMAAFDHLIKLDQMGGEARWFALRELDWEGKDVNPAS
jgi:hypothetical protein